MLAFVLRRVLSTIPVMAIVAFAVFMLLRLSPGDPAAVIAGGIVLSISLLPGWMTPPLAIFGFLWVLNGAGQALIAIPSSTLVASHTSTDERGRAFAAQFAITHACWLISYPLVGHLAGALGPPIAFSICGIACLAITVVAVVIGRGEKGAHVHST